MKNNARRCTVLRDRCIRKIMQGGIEGYEIDVLEK